MINLNLHSDNSEIVPYNFDDFHVHAREDTLSNYAGNAAPIHWHKDLEFIEVVDGSMIYNVNGEEVLLEKGNGIFINSGQLHGHYSIKNSNCRFLCIIIPLEFYSQFLLILNKYVTEFCFNSGITYLYLSQNDLLGDKLLENLKEFFYICIKQEKAFELQAISCMYSIFNLLVKNVDTKISISSSSPWLNNLHEMIGYVQRNYKEKISLEDIAFAGNVSRSKCCEIFKELMHSSPNDYVISYRINRGMDLLKNSTLSITEIAFECGFLSSSYFAETFKKLVGKTPKEYRNY